MSRRSGLALAAGLLGLAAAAPGCNIAAYVLQKTLAPVVPEEKVKAEVSLSGRSLLVLVDTGDPGGTADFPRLPTTLARQIVKVLQEHGATGPIVPPQSVEAARRSEPDFDRWSVVQVGRYFNVDYVLHVTVHEFRIRETPASNVLDGYAETTICLVSPEAGTQAWPLLASARQVSAQTLPDIALQEEPAEVEAILLEGLADKIARHFYTYKRDDLPLRPKVR